MNASDVRVGDLVKATHKKRPESTFTGRVTGVTDYWVDAVDWSASIPHHDFEVLDRPLPPIDEELLRGADKAYRLGQGYGLSPFGKSAYDDGVTAVINFVREYDQKNATKENA